ncbi:helix-turn-helix domain-containing protein [Priestia flexa]|uniref:helix-turn-helix domain-containing protein n=1 Tax=Priestia flexa TaxID=86664 RepID=UPI00209E90FF|nr:helix-turn-helix transcriptional regulator [Priestia flexa]MCP1191435.1 helix-turn-helix domain-containing protein [Priestia flexa]
MNELKKYIGTKIKGYRKELKITSVELGKLSNTSQTTISGIERGDRFASFEVMIKICEVLGITLYDVLPSEVTKNLDLNVLDRNDERINIILSTMAPEDIEIAENLLLNHMSFLKDFNNLTPEAKEYLTKFIHSISGK